MGLLLAITDPYTVLFYGWCLGLITVALPFALYRVFWGGHGR